MPPPDCSWLFHQFQFEIPASPVGRLQHLRNVHRLARRTTTARRMFSGEWIAACSGLRALPARCVGALVRARKTRFKPTNRASVTNPGRAVPHMQGALLTLRLRASAVKNWPTGFAHSTPLGRSIAFQRGIYCAPAGRAVAPILVGRAVLCPPDAESTGCFSRTNRLLVRSRARKGADGGIPAEKPG